MKLALEERVEAIAPAYAEQFGIPLATAKREVREELLRIQAMGDPDPVNERR